MTRIRTLLTVLVLLLLPASLAAQRPGGAPAGGGAGTLRGTVVSGEGSRPLPSVSIVVRSARDSSVVAGELSGPDGRFRVAGLRPGRYLLEASSLGFAPYRAPVAVTRAAPAVDLGTIVLTPSAIALQGIEVTGERSQMVVAPDRTIYSTRDMPVAAGGLATDVLRSVPELEVEVDGSVQLRGTAAQIYLNGRPAPMEGEALQVFLQQFPADRIERVEVIANPSARFQAEGAGGIVNIVLKQNTSLGLSGNLFLNGSTRGSAGAGGRLAWQSGPITLFGGGFVRREDRYQTSYDLRRNLLAAPVTELEQEAWSDNEGWSGNADLTAEYKLTPRSTLFAESRVYRNGRDAEGVTVYTETLAGGGFLTSYDRATLDDQVRLSTDLTLGFRHVLEERRHELSAEIEYEGGGEEELEEVRRRLLDPAGDPLASPVELTLDEVDERETSLSARADYVRPWGELGQVELGYRGEREESGNDRLLEVFASEGSGVPGVVTDRGFDFRETFHSGYLTLARKLGPLQAQAGVRAEVASTELELPGDGGLYANDYFSVFPNANLSYELAEGREVRASYSRRIRRPQPWVLNPLDQSTDPLNRRVGNPEIDPQYTHSFSLDLSSTEPWGTLRLSPYLRRTLGDWAQIKRVDAAGVSTVTWENLASVDAYGASVTASLRPVGGVGGFLSVDGARESRDASNLSLDYSGDYWRWSARGNVSARLTPSLSLQAMGFYRPARHVPQGRISSSLMTHVGIRQQFLNRRATLNLMVMDPLDVWRSSFETSDPTHVQIGRSRWSMRSAVLSFSYAFGRPPRDARDQRGEQDQEPEAEIR